MSEQADCDPKASTEPRKERDWRNMSVVEVAAENPSVSDYVNHWEGRVLKAESSLSEKSRRVEELQGELAKLKEYRAEDKRAFDAVRLNRDGIEKRAEDAELALFHANKIIETFPLEWKRQMALESSAARLKDAITEKDKALNGCIKDLENHRTLVMELWGLKGSNKLTEAQHELTMKYWNANCGPFDRSVKCALSLPAKEALSPAPVEENGELELLRELEKEVRLAAQIAPLTFGVKVGLSNLNVLRQSLPPGESR